MQFYSIFDLLVQTANQRNISIDDMIAFFKANRITKARLLETRKTTYNPDDNELNQVVLSYLGINEIELSLRLGKIPRGYEDAYNNCIPQIAALLEKMNKANDTPKAISPVFSSKYGVLYNEDCISVMKNLKTSSFDLIFADPPFNLNKEYDDVVNDDLSMTDYLNWTMKWVDECVRILKPGGYLFIYNIPKWCTYIAGYLNQCLTYWDWIAIDMKYRLPINGRLYPAHYGLLAYVKGSTPTTYNNQRIPLQTCRHCGGEIKDYGGYKSKLNSMGINVSDVWSDIYPVRHKNTKNRRYNELPVKLLDRVISMTTNEGDLVFDPFGGSGTTYAVSEILKRRWVGSEIGNCDIIMERINNLNNDKLQLKKINLEKGRLFTQQAQMLREKNGLWLVDQKQVKWSDSFSS